MPVFANRLDFEHLRHDLGLELHHQAHDARLVTPGTQQLDIWVVVRHLARQAVEDAVEFDTLDIDHQPVGILDGEMGEFEGSVMLEGNPRVVGGRPDPHREHGRLSQRGASQRGNRENQRGAGATQELSSPDAEFTAFMHCAPSGVFATASRTRPRPA